MWNSLQGGGSEIEGFPLLRTKHTGDRQGPGDWGQDTHTQTRTHALVDCLADTHTFTK